MMIHLISKKYFEKNNEGSTWRMYGRIFHFKKKFTGLEFDHGPILHKI